MSTKASLLVGPGFHLYEELAEEKNNIYLSMEKAEFSASRESVTIKIPTHILHLISQFSQHPFRFANMSEQQIRKFVVSSVEKRIAEYGEENNERVRGFLNFAQSAVFGAASDPMEVQISNGIEHFMALRSYEQSVKQQVEDSRRYSEPSW